MWRDQHPAPKVEKQPCGRFYGSLSTPGVCSVCDLTWLRHKPVNRGLVIEAFIDLHKGWCKCIIMNGDVQCSCMTDTEVQEALDKLGKGISPKMACKQFKPKARGNTHCECGEAFYVHSHAACDGHREFMQWRAAHLSNKELLEWFQLLPGKNRGERLMTLRRLLADPHYKFVPPTDVVNPNSLTMLALLDALDTHSNNILSPRDLAKDDDDLTIEATVINAEDLPLNPPPEKYHCHSCGDMEAPSHGALCVGCSDFLGAGGHLGGPALRTSNDKGGS